MGSRYRDIFYECCEESAAFFTKLQEDTEHFAVELDKETEPFFKAVQKFIKTGEIDAKTLGIDASELNKEKDEENGPTKKGRLRKKKPVLAEVTEDNIQVEIKKEKISEVYQPVTESSTISSTTGSIAEIKENIKNEKDDMPAPSWIPPKKKIKEIKTEKASLRSTRTRGKKGAQSVRDSDVMVQDATITTINLSSDTDDSDHEKIQTEETNTRSTRTKTRKAQNADSGAETDTESARSTRTKTRNRKEPQNEEPSGEVEKLTRSTRTKTIRKAEKVDEDDKTESSEEPQPEARSTRTKTIRKETAEVSSSSNTNKGEAPTAKNTRSTRTKAKKLAENTTEVTATSNDIPETTETNETNQVKGKRNRSDSTDEEAIQKTERKKSKSNSPSVGDDAIVNTTTQTVYEDAKSILGPSQEQAQASSILNCTYVSSKPAATEETEIPLTPLLDTTVTSEPAVTSIINSTVVLDKPTYNIFDKKSNNLLLTDDESIEIKTPPKKVTKPKTGKEVFSPYEKTTLKKKVEAFEKLQTCTEVPIKTTSNLRLHNKGTPSSVKEKAKLFTPLGSKFMPSSSSTSKISRLISHQHNSTNNESLLAMKSAQKESRDRQKKLLEREQALKKKEAMLQATADAKRKLNEEKQLKALQQRKALEAEKLKQLEHQKQKEERQKLREIEKEKHLQEQKLEAEKKRQAHKKKMQEMQAQRQQILDEQNKHPPVYITTKLPKLPTEDCYDSDDPDFRKITPPSWCSGEHSRAMQFTMLAAGEKIKNTLFCRHAQTPDLTDIFEVIDPKKLKRSSSVLWRKPPRYTMMPDLNETRFSEDDEFYESD